MGGAGEWRGWWAAWARRVSGAPQALVAVGVLLALAAVTESIVRVAAATPSLGSTLVLSVLAVSVLALATTVPLAFMGPAAAAVAICSATVLSLAVFRTLTAAGFAAQLITLYRLGLEGSPRRGARLLAPGLAAPFLVLALAAPASSEAGVLTVLLAALCPAAAWAGIARRAGAEAQLHRAARQLIAATLVEQTARGERARIAHELHDVVAHHISMIAVQAETARLTTPGMPAAGAQRLAEIGDTARAGLTEMRRLLGVLREDAHANHADRQPQPGLQQLNELLDEARDTSGAGTRLIVCGLPVTLGPGTELAAYRIVQEALTNARRHAPGAAVDVELRYTHAALRLRIRDNGPGPPPAPPGGGHGLPGMRERAAATGGELRTGRAEGGGFLIEATLPAKAEVAG